MALSNQQLSDYGLRASADSRFDVIGPFDTVAHLKYQAWRCLALTLISEVRVISNMTLE